MYVFIHTSIHNLLWGAKNFWKRKTRESGGIFCSSREGFSVQRIFVHFHIMDFLWSCHLPLFVFFYIINNHLLPFLFARVEDVKHCPKKCKCASCNFRFHRINHISRPNKAYFYVGLLQFFFNRVNLINLTNPADLMVPRIQPIFFGANIFLQFGLKLNCWAVHRIVDRGRRHSARVELLQFIYFSRKMGQQFVWAKKGKFAFKVPKRNQKEFWR